MDNFQHFAKQVRGRIFAVLIMNNILIFAAWYFVRKILNVQDEVIVVCSMITAGTFAVCVLPWFTTHYITEPTRLLWQGILHIAPDAVNTPAPNLKKRTIGHDMVVNLVGHVYQLASVVDEVERTAKDHPGDLAHNFVANYLPIPLLILDKSQTILFANKSMLDMIQHTAAEAIGQNLYSVLDMSFADNSGKTETFDRWLENAKATLPVGAKTWERVRLNVADAVITPQFDMAAYYNKSNPEGFETMLVFFDKTASYAQDDQDLSFVALAVHELRTPITLLRGYIEVLEEEMDGKLDPETAQFVHKMKAAAQSLTAFINNMLNVARIENDQLQLKLHEDTWPEIIKGVVDDLSLRAKVVGIGIHVELAANLPSVGVDRVSIYEVLANLIDNAIKYSSKGTGKKVTIKATLNSDGLVETTIQDNGIGIPNSVLPNLFEKFYRSHRSKNQVGGTGLGLYLSKTIVEAHGGNIWVRSKEGEGTTFGFTVIPYAKLADEKKTGDNNNISRGAHGWIKNHSLYSR
jgi:signal transduction histidine kinase